MSIHKISTDTDYHRNADRLLTKSGSYPLRRKKKQRSFLEKRLAAAKGENADARKHERASYVFFSLVSIFAISANLFPWDSIFWHFFFFWHF